ncbi:MAG: hypothetical protein MR619_07395, partial [Eubacterium sp.]|nr:hypothetical protein [Eubacterium sp.]
MFYEFSDDVVTVSIENINPHYVTAGYVTVSEFEKIYEHFGFARSNVESLGQDAHYSRFGVEVNDDYCFTKLSVINAQKIMGEKDIIALFIKKNLLIVVDVADSDGSTRDKFMSSLGKYSP